MNFFTMLGIIIAVVGIVAIIIVAKFRPLNQDNNLEKPAIATKVWREDRNITPQEDMSPIARSWNEPMINDKDIQTNENFNNFNNEFNDEFNDEYPSNDHIKILSHTNEINNDNNDNNSNGNENINNYDNYDGNYAEDNYSEDYTNITKEKSSELSIDTEKANYETKYQLPTAKPKSKYPPKPSYSLDNGANDSISDGNDTDNSDIDNTIENDYDVYNIESINDKDVNNAQNNKNKNNTEEDYDSIDYEDSDDLIGSLIGDYSKSKKLDDDSNIIDNNSSTNIIDKKSVESAKDVIKPVKTSENLDNTDNINENISKLRVATNNTVSKSNESVKVPKRGNDVEKSNLGKIKKYESSIKDTNPSEKSTSMKKDDLSNLGVGDYIIFNYDDTTYSSKILATNHDNIKIKYRFKERWIDKKAVKKVLDRKKY
ncbi:MAG: hypothetical protein ACRC1M_05625 [Methanobacteriaceae archaeon]